MSSIATQKVVKVRLAWGYPEQAAHLLTLSASEGHRYGGHAVCLSRGGGAIYVRPRGIYLDDCLFWLDPAPGGSLFHAWRLACRENSDLTEELNKLVEYENANGFSLVALIPLDAFAANEAAGPRTAGYFALFERLAENDVPLMLDRWTLRPKRQETEEGIPCPVIGCQFVAPRMTAAGPNLNSSKDRLADYLCPRHRIYISPTTFEYAEPTISLLWPGDKETARRLAGAGKRTWARMGRERDEDSLTWNVFRYMERNGLLEKLLSDLLKASPALPALGPAEKVVYWSVDIERMTTWESLQQARNSVGEGAIGSEPDVIAVFQRAVVLIEVKLDSPSVTVPPSPFPACYRDEHGVFKIDLQSAADVIGYELMRFFLLGEALRKQLKKPLAVISLIRDGLDDDLPRRVCQAIHLDAARCYHRLTWGEVYKFIEQSKVDDPVEQMIMVRYLRGKTLGYDGTGVLRTLLP